MNILIAFLALASAGVFAAHIIDAFQAYYDSLDTGRMGVMRLTMTNGTILVRKPAAPTTVGGNIAGGTRQLADLARERDAGVVRTTSPVDGVVRWTWSRGTPWSRPLRS